LRKVLEIEAKVLDIVQRLDTKPLRNPRGPLRMTGSATNVVVRLPLLVPWTWIILNPAQCACHPLLEVAEEDFGVASLVQTIALRVSTLVANLEYVVRVLDDLCIMRNHSLEVGRDTFLTNALVAFLDVKIALE